MNYEEFRENGWKSYEDGAKVVSFFCKRNPNDPEGIGKVLKQPPEINYDKMFDLSDVIGMIRSKFYTKTGTLRVKYINMKPYETYMLSGLMLYCNQCKLEGSKKAILSWQEWYFLREDK